MLLQACISPWHFQRLSKKTLKDCPPRAAPKSSAYLQQGTHRKESSILQHQHADKAQQQGLAPPTPRQKGPASSISTCTTELNQIEAPMPSINCQ
ncbi:hypothetical protein Nepgr_018796 [Nepenthes gracilis]|uniref:Uncharacterized protein n=1 Tax=Nepenthes gracilis TaxID=150966 RepID=A0AAD3SS52_NEPGR|nr:hypothetical protein Nepgr_018796 [Nepenthes gracilis]